jgi:NAD(P)-dependent dehydrogenase (short-subunit alcohol dehydrogenase family)
MPPQLWNQVTGINLSGVFYSSQAAARQMHKQGGGVIISIASMAGKLGFPGRAPYCAAKAGVIALTQTLGCEWASAHIRVNAVAPGYVMTEMVERNVQSGAVNLEKVNQRTPMGRAASPQEVADLVVMLASDYAVYVTGETVSIDGGWTAYGSW